MNSITCLPLIWAGLIGFCIVMYVILDGFTLGTGALLGFMSSQERDLAISMLLPTWDGNQTWLVLGMASLYGAFPLAFSTILPMLYLPLFLMVLCLLFRGVAFEFRLKSPDYKTAWDTVFSLASIAATLIQGYMVGCLARGYDSPHPSIDWFVTLTAFGLLAAYLLLGVTRLIVKTEGELQNKMFRLAPYIMVLASLFLLAVCIATPFVHPHLKALWFNFRDWSDLFILPLITLVLWMLVWRSLLHRREKSPYFLSILFVLCPYAGFGINIFPYIVPYHLSIWQSASPPGTLVFLLVGAAIMIPVLLIYTGYAYHIFRGKVRENIHY